MQDLFSARRQREITTECILKELEKGFLTGPFNDIPFKTYRINPVGIVESKYSHKKRMIVDLSAPHEDDLNPSLNELIDKEEFSLQYVTIDHAVKIIKRCGQGSWLCKTDISDAFKLIPIAPSLWPFHGIQWDNKYYFYTRLVFGSRSSPKIFDSLSTAICWIATHHFNVRNILHLLDDFLTIDSPEFDADRTMAILTLLFKQLGIPLASHKTVGPTHCLEYLGIILDSDKMEARLPTDKIKRICEIIQSFLNRKSCTKRQLLSLLGHLNFACRVIQPGRSFISYLISVSTTVKKLHHHVFISKECKLDLNMWLRFLSQWNGVSFFLNDEFTEAPDLHLYTYATNCAFGGINGKKWFQGYFPVEILDNKTNYSMAFF